MENQEQRMDPSGNQSGRSQDSGRCRPGIGTGEREHAACNLQEIGQWQGLSCNPEVPHSSEDQPQIDPHQHPSACGTSVDRRI